MGDSYEQFLYYQSLNGPWKYHWVKNPDKLEKAKHINELKTEGKFTIHLDTEQAGVGTATCGPGVLPHYLVPIREQQFEFTLYPLN